MIIYETINNILNKILISVERVTTYLSLRVFKVCGIYNNMEITKSYTH